MAYHKITLTQNGEYIAFHSDSHKTDILSCNIAGTFANGASLIETTALTTGNGNIGREVPLRDSNGIQVVISQTTQYSRSATLTGRWYILTVQNATGLTNIEFDVSSIKNIKHSETATVENL